MTIQESLQGAFGKNSGLEQVQKMFTGSMRPFSTRMGICIPSTLKTA